MADEKDKEHFDLEPADEGDSGKSEPFKVEQPVDSKAGDPVAAVPLEDVEHCPHCGAALSDRHALVCLRCGYDLKTLKVQKTAVGETVIEEDDDAARAVSRPGRGDLWLPLTMAGVSAVVLTIGSLAGVLGLFPSFDPQGAEAASVPVGMRLVAVVRMIVLLGLWTGCGLAGLFLLAQTLQRTVGDLQLAAARVLGIVATIRLVSLLDMPGPRWVEWMGEAVLQFGVYVLLCIALFALKPRDGLVMGVFSLLAILTLWLFAWAMVWTIEGSV